MRMDLGLSQTIRQIQTLSPQMYMSMEILCLNSIDLEERIEQELEENIALELSEGKPEVAGTSADGESKEGEEWSGGETAAAATDSTAAPDVFDQKVDHWDRLAREEYDFPSGSRSTPFDGDGDEKLEALQNTAGRPMSFQEYLEQQVHLLPRSSLGEAPEAMIELCSAIIFNIDDRGYLMYPVEEILQSLLGDPAAQKTLSPATLSPASLPPAALAGAAPAPVSTVPPVAGPRLSDAAEALLALRSPPTREQLQKALEIVQSLDPPGVGGRDLKECLLLQLRRDQQTYTVETQIIEQYLEDLGANRLPKIAKALGITVEDVKAATELIASLNPLPGKLFGGESPNFIKPDVVVQEIDGKYEVRVESEHLPRLQVSSYYRDLYRQAGKDAELKKFVKKKLESAEWLIAAIRQRQSTLLRTAQEIVAIQTGFLDHGISHLKPLKMVEVAERVGVHVSTISRAISGKYIQTPRGIFDLKFFFTGGTVKSDGSMEARGSVIQRIKNLVEGEDKANPFSDVDIVNKLIESGITISRRTVTKYREAENIPSSRQRRSY